MVWRQKTKHGANKKVTMVAAILQLLTAQGIPYVKSHDTRCAGVEAVEKLEKSVAFGLSLH